MSASEFDFEQLFAEGYTPPSSEDQHGFKEERYQLQKVSVTHDQIMNWLIANPGTGMMGRCAIHFGLTPAWLSTIVHTDAFQAQLRDKQEKLFEAHIMPLEEKIVGTAHAAIDKLGEAIMTEASTRVLADTTDKLLNRLGYGATGGPTTVNNTQNNYNVPKDMYAQARERMRARGEVNAQTVESTLPSPEGLSSGELIPAGDGGAQSQSPSISHGGQEADGSPGEGTEV